MLKFRSHLWPVATALASDNAYLTKLSFALKVSADAASALPPELASRRRLCPAVETPVTFWAMPLVRPSGPINSKGQARTRGHSPEIIWLLSAGHSHRREANSGGKADKGR